MPLLTGLRKLLASSAAALVLALFVACGGDDPTPSDAATVQPTPTATAMPTAVPTATPDPTVIPEPTAVPTPELPSSNAPQIEGRWEGISTIPALGALPFTINFSMSGPALLGKLDIPDQNAFGLDLSNVTFQSGRLHFELDSPVGLAIWDGELLNGTIEGDFKQSGLEGTFRLERADVKAPPPSTEPPEVARYQREQLEFSNGDITLAGDLTLPDPGGPHPAVILISGSGGQDRDSNFYGFRVFEALADHIASRGIAVLRFDDRGTGGSTGDWLQTTLQDRASDVAAALAWLQANDDIDSERIGLVGHSEGGLVALIVATQTDGIAHLALLATPAVRGDELLRAQQLKILEVSGADPEMIEQAQAHQELVLRAALTGEGWDAVEQSVRTLARQQIEAMPDDVRKDADLVEAYLEVAIPQQMESLQSPWFRSFIQYDPKPDVLVLDIPVLTLFGVLDTQVPVDQNSTAMSEALDESNISSYSLASIWPANHLFQEAETGGIDEYAVLDPEFAPEFLEFLLDWLAMRIASP